MTRQIFEIEKLEKNFNSNNFDNFLSNYLTDKPVLTSCLKRLNNKDQKTYEHVTKVAKICFEVVTNHYDESLLEPLIYAVLIHDLGKIVFPEIVGNFVGKIDEIKLGEIRKSHMIGMKKVLDEEHIKIIGQREDIKLIDRAYSIAMAHHDILPTDLFEDHRYPRKYGFNTNHHHILKDKDDVLMAIILSMADKVSRVGVLTGNDIDWKNLIEKTSYDDINPTVADLTSLTGNDINPANAFLQKLGRTVWEVGENLKTKKE